MQPVGARRASAGDLGVITTLTRHGIAELSSLKGGTVWAATEARREPIEDGVHRDLGDPAVIVAVGTIGDVVVGHSVARDVESTCVVSELYVEPGGREVGVGAAMLQTIVDWAAERGCTGIESAALPGDRATKNFFESHGMVARLIRVHRPLSGPAAPSAP